MLQARAFRAALLCLLLAAGSPGALAAAPHPWRGRMGAAEAFIPDLDRPVRAALVSLNPEVLPADGPDWRAVATRFNALQLSMRLPYSRQDENARKILDALAAGSRMFASHPEIANLGVVLFGFSAGSAAAGRTASSPLLSNPDPKQPPQRVLAVIGLDEIDGPPYTPPLSTPHLFLSDPGDVFGGLSTFVENLSPPVTHDAFARGRAAEGAPITVVSQPGHWHGGASYSFRNRVDFAFLRVWLEEVLAARLPAQAPVATPALAPDWRFHSGWLGAYDVAAKTGAPPWGDDERMVDVAIFPRAGRADQRPFVWLPSERAAEAWRRYAIDGVMPPREPDRPLAVADAFVRPGADSGKGRADVHLTRVGDPPRPREPSPGRCGVQPGEAATVFVVFDRAIAAGAATIEGPATADGATRVWGDVLIAPAKGVPGEGPLTVALRGVAPKDGGPPADIDLSAPCR